MLLFDVVTKYHPVMHTAFLGITIYLGHTIFNSWNIGLLIHSIVQMIIMASIFSYTLIYLYKKKIPSYLLLFFLIVYLFLPTHSVFSITTTKDVLFSGLFNIVLICYIELCTNKKFFTKKNMIITILSTFLLISFRNNMIYAFILFIPFILLYYKKNFKKLAKFVDGMPHVFAFNSAAWCIDTELPFAAKAGRQSAITAGSENMVGALSVDSVLGKKPATIIKMDVEGFEREAIWGAALTISHYAPKMMVSLYHRNEDIFELPLLIKKLNPSYKLYIRHQLYIPAWETNLYATV